MGETWVMNVDLWWALFWFIEFNKKEGRYKIELAVINDFNKQIRGFSGYRGFATLSICYKEYNNKEIRL